jgi:hypothetical protein
MAYKPQFAVRLRPVALLAWGSTGDQRAGLQSPRRRRSRFAFVALSTAVMGTDVLTAFFANMPFVRRLMEGGFTLEQMPTVFALLRLSASASRRYHVQALCASPPSPASSRCGAAGFRSPCAVRC